MVEFVEDETEGINQSINHIFQLGTVHMVGEVILN